MTESANDKAAAMTIGKASGKWVAFTAGAVFAETQNALEIREGDSAPVIYFPRGDIAMAFFDKTEKTTHCPKKGDSSYYSIAAKSRVIVNAAWSYEDPIEDAKVIKDYLAFDPDQITVERQ